MSWISSSTSPSIISVLRTWHSAASSVIRIGCGAAAKSEGYIFIARARHPATIFSDAPSNRPSGSFIALTRCSLVISASSVSNVSGPGSSFSSCRNARDVRAMQARVRRHFNGSPLKFIQWVDATLAYPRHRPDR